MKTNPILYGHTEYIACLYKINAYAQNKPEEESNCKLVRI